MELKNYFSFSSKDKNRAIALFFFCKLIVFNLEFSIAQVESASYTGFTWIETESNTFNSGAGLSFYSAVWPVLKNFPGDKKIQTGLAGAWLTTLKTGNEPENFYNTIEGGLGWWADTRFATETPKFIMGGVSFDFFSWANGVGAGRTELLPDGRRDWSEPGGKYGVAQLSPYLLWPPDGLNMKRGSNGELLGYGYTPLPLTDPMPQTNGINIMTGNQCWTLFLNTKNFKGPTTFFLPTFWTDPVLEDPRLEGLFLDTRPSDRNLSLGIELAYSPAYVANSNNGLRYGRINPFQYPISSENKSLLMSNVQQYSRDALWYDMVAWFSGGPIVKPGFNEDGVSNNLFDTRNNGANTSFEILQSGQSWHDYTINTDQFLETYLEDNGKVLGYQWNPDIVKKEGNNFIVPEYYRYDTENRWYSINASN